MQDGKTAPSEVTELIRLWIKARQGEGWTLTRVGSHLGVSRTQIQNVLIGSRNAGLGLESAFAEREYGGSIDALRKAAKESGATQRGRRETELLPNLREAIGILRSRGEVNETTVERARRVAQAAGDFTVHTWLMVLIDLSQVGPKDTAPSSSRSR